MAFSNRFPHTGLWAVVLLTALTLSACDSSDSMEDGAVSLDMAFVVDGADLVLNQMNYTNAAGNDYSVARAQFYLSDVELMRDDGGVYTVDDLHYFSAEDPSTLTWTIDDVPGGTYTGISFVFGLDEARNQTGALANTTANNNMIWPDAMGGGYHHAKVEGFWDQNGTNMAYNVHLGLTNYAVVRDVAMPDVEVDGGETAVTLTMDVNEFFESPTVYDFADYPVMIMGNAQAQGILSANAADAFSASR